MITWCKIVYNCTVYVRFFGLMALRFSTNAFMISSDMPCTFVICIQYSVLCDSVYSLTVCTVSADGTIITVSYLWTTLMKSLHNFRSLYILRNSYDVTFLGCVLFFGLNNLRPV